MEKDTKCPNMMYPFMSDQKADKKRQIIFIGTMNAMPMMYAIELRKLGFNVAYVVDAPKQNTLSRPECHFPEISYPYPDWIIEFLLPTQLVVALTPSLLLLLLNKKLSRRGFRLTNAILITNGFHHCLLRHLSNQTIKVALTHGSDLDEWAYKAGALKIFDGMKNRSIFKFLPSCLSKLLIMKIVDRQHNALESADHIIYFPRGLNENGDKITDELEQKGVNIIRRYDVSFSIPSQVIKEKKDKDSLFLLSPVRFLFKKFPGGNIGYNKGNDQIIEGIAKFAKHGIPFKIHFFEKGEDVDIAKKLIKKFDLEDHVIWHKEMPFYELLKLYEKADIVFDQVGSHWIGAVGIYALYLGIPLIANATNLVSLGLIPKENPIYNASNANEIYERLIKITQCKEENKIGFQLQNFATKYFGPERVLQHIVNMAYLIKP